MDGAYIIALFERECLYLLTTVACHISSALTGVYWKLGKLLVGRKLGSKHGSGVVRRLAPDLKQQFPDMDLSELNLWYMKRFYLRYVEETPKLKQVVAVLPWGHNVLLMDKGLDSAHVAFYAQEVLAQAKLSE